MIQPIVQDYIDAAVALECEGFCRQADAAVLIPALEQVEGAFQSAPTRMLGPEESTWPQARRARLDHRAPVFELRSARGTSPEISIGRAEENDVVLSDETVSACHAFFRIEPQSAVPSLQDRESTNGTQINGRALLPFRRNPLRDGDLISFGDALYLFYTPAGLWQALRRLLAG